MFDKTCTYCRQKIPKSQEVIKHKVRVYGKVGTFKRDFCSEDHVTGHQVRTEEFNRRRRTCIPCAIR